MRKIINSVKDFFAQKQSKTFKLLTIVSIVVAVVIAMMVVINVSVVAKTNSNINSLVEFLYLPEDFDCVLVLGAGVRSDGSPSPMLRDRLIVGHEAYYTNKSDVIFVSGDSEKSSYTETAAMKEFLENMGVDSASIICDGYGLSTYDSIWRAKNVYGFNNILIISQGYHLNRAIYIAEELGMNAYGIDSALRSYAKQPLYSLRECIARIKDVIYVKLSITPKYTEKWEDING